MSVEVALEQVRSALALLNQSIDTLTGQLQTQHQALISEHTQLQANISELNRIMHEAMPPRREASGTFVAIRPEAPAYTAKAPKDEGDPRSGTIAISRGGGVRLSPGAIKWVGRAVLALMMGLIGYLSRYINETDSHGTPPAVSATKDGGP